MINFFIKGMNSCPMRNQNIDKYRKYFISLGYNETSYEQDANIIMLWTCSFREDMAENSLSNLVHLKETYIDKQIFVAGCMPDILPERLTEITGINIIPWKQENSLFPQYFPPVGKHKLSLESCSVVYSEAPIERNNPYFMDSFIKLLVSEGCNEKCAYCSERLAFPPYKSFSINELISEVKRVRNKEGGNPTNNIAIIGDSPGEYGNDIGENIISLIYSLCEVSDSIKIVLHNFNPVFFLQYIKEFEILVRNNKIHHINLPIQSASDRVLKVMKRRYTQSDLDIIFDSLRSWKFFNYDTHIIAGFPTESKEEFNETVEFLYKKRPKYVLASPCMIALGATASTMSPKISADEKKSRLLYLDERLTSVGVIVNNPYNNLAKKRIESINLSLGGINNGY